MGSKELTSSECLSALRPLREKKMRLGLVLLTAL